ncbi:unnamed protein product, partial [Discosporangium mesarthrocarpum]
QQQRSSVVFRWGIIHVNNENLAPEGTWERKGEPKHAHSTRHHHHHHHRHHIARSWRAVLRPEVVVSLVGLGVHQVSCGERHTAAL